MRTRMTRVLGGLAAALLALGAQAQNLSFLQGMPVSRLSEEDRAYFRKALGEVLASEDENAERSWTNPAGSAKGTIRLVKVVKEDPDYGVECRTVLVHNEVNGVPGEARTRLCRSKDGEWRLAPKSKKK